MHPRHVSTVLIQLNVVLLLYGINAKMCVPLKTATTVKCSDNNYTGITVSHPVQFLYFKNNSLNDIRIFENITTVKAVYLANNNIENLNITPNWSQLNTISLAYNRIKIVPKHAFISCKKLQTVILNGNDIQTINDEAFYNLPITYLNLAENSLQQHSFLSQTPNLTRLNLSQNKILQVENFTSYKLLHLTSLNLSHNQISAIPPGFIDGLPALETLDVSYNKIRTIGVILSTGSIRSFNLEFNEIQALKNLNFDSYISEGTRIQLENNKLTCSFIEAVYRSKTKRIVLRNEENEKGQLLLGCHDSHDNGTTVSSTATPYFPNMDSPALYGYKYMVIFITACILITFLLSGVIFIYFCVRKDKKHPMPVHKRSISITESNIRRALPTSQDDRTPFQVPSRTFRRGRPLPSLPNELAPLRVPSIIQMSSMPNTRPLKRRTEPPEDESGYMIPDENVYSTVDIVDTTNL